VFLEYCGRDESALELLKLPSPMDLSPKMELDEDVIRHFSFMLSSMRRVRGEPPETPKSDVFISYPRTKLDWVKKHVYAPLCDWRGEENIFIDTDKLDPGSGWMPSLANAVGACDVFLAVYCEDYFRSQFCQWELQLALLRDPNGEKRIVVPFMLEKLQPPNYCVLVHALDLTGKDADKEIVRVLDDIFSLEEDKE